VINGLLDAVEAIPPATPKQRLVPFLDTRGQLRNQLVGVRLAHDDRRPPIAVVRDLTRTRGELRRTLLMGRRGRREGDESGGNDHYYASAEHGPSYLDPNRTA
jgi:hypothetical protein